MNEQLVLKTSTLQALQGLAEEQGQSASEFVETIVDHFLNDRVDLSDLLDQEFTKIQQLRDLAVKYDFLNLVEATKLFFDPKEIPLTNGGVAVVNLIDYIQLQGHSWVKDGNGYVRAKIDGKTALMHRRIMKPPDGMVVDHLNHDRLDNRRENLRICTPQANAANRKVTKSARRYRGVYPVMDESGNVVSYRAEIGHANVRIIMGFFGSEEEAARNYDAAARCLDRRAVSVK